MQRCWIQIFSAWALVVVPEAWKWEEKLWAFTDWISTLLQSRVGFSFMRREICEVTFSCICVCLYVFFNGGLLERLAQLIPLIKIWLMWWPKKQKNMQAWISISWTLWLDRVKTMVCQLYYILHHESCILHDIIKSPPACFAERPWLPAEETSVVPNGLRNPDLMKINPSMDPHRVGHGECLSWGVVPAWAYEWDDGWIHVSDLSGRQKARRWEEVDDLLLLGREKTQQRSW